MRPNTSFGRSAEVVISQNVRITASPTAWPCVSLTALNRSRSNIMTETGDLSRRQRSKTRSALSKESGSVGDTRQRIRAASHPAGNLVALLEQRENKHGGAKRKDDAFKI